MIRDDLNLSYEKLNEKSNEDNQNFDNQDVAFLEVNSKEIAETVVWLVTRLETTKINFFRVAGGMAKIKKIKC